jgi:hypothetical protein
LDKKIDYLIVGQGLSGTCFAWRSYFGNKTFKIIDKENSFSASKASVGIYNPITGRKYNVTWNVDKLFYELKCFYKKVEKKLNQKLLYEKNIFRPFKGNNEVNDWNIRLASKKYLKFCEKINDDGVLTNTSGYLDVNKFLLSSKKYFDNLRRYKSENFDKTKLKIKKNYFSYKNEEFKYVIMCTGISEKKINLFKDIKLNGVSGNSIIVKSKIGNDSIINKGINILPIKKNVYHIGSTYYHNMKDEGPDELVSKTKNLIKEDISLIDSKFGIRSTSKDRRPIIGEHNKIKKLFIMNAMGSKGVSQAPYCSKKLFNYINKDKNIDKEINIDRYRS